MRQTLFYVWLGAVLTKGIQYQPTLNSIERLQSGDITLWVHIILEFLITLIPVIAYWFAVSTGGKGFPIEGRLVTVLISSACMRVETITIDWFKLTVSDYYWSLIAVFVVTFALALNVRALIPQFNRAK
ncbi:hypothetical protein LNL84_06055 [Vibrio sp. ZSDZ34]|uniref:Uncharacterized protein n=1 Tax=Vibrio gelatinilyticus TaxID=2893468 RepID=A0A9X1WDG2_9VIBR|nr:hypothetical protein [Vibrio gelatinilyticus]MCJ2376395.1 hypothetical protein [Vibrio gelatinilyticus]